MDECLCDCDAILKELQHNLLLAQNHMNCQVDQHRLCVFKTIAL
jgi:hypothetical protein